MEIIAQTKSIRISTRKVRLVADTIRDMSPQEAVATLALVRKRGAGVLTKTLKSAMANAGNNYKLSPNDLIIYRLEVNEGPFLKRFRPSTRGRVHPYKKRSSHIKIVLKQKAEARNSKSETNTKSK